jgi:hypothetical protein
MVDNWDGAEDEGNEIFRAREGRVDTFSIILVVFLKEVWIAVEEILQSLIVRLHGKAYGLVLKAEWTEGIEKNSIVVYLCGHKCRERPCLRGLKPNWNDEVRRSPSACAISM